jgi:hypothetical protein
VGQTVGTCESCGSSDESLVAVRRIYVTPEAWDTAGRIEVAEVETWCFVCRTHYPHHELDADGNRVDDALSWPDPAAGGDGSS